MSHGGYTTAELYAITYGIRDITKSIEKYFLFNYKSYNWYTERVK